MNTLFIIVRWAAFIPAALVAYVIGAWAVFFGVSRAKPEAAAAVRYAPDQHLLTGQMWFQTSTELVGMIAGCFGGVGIAYETVAFEDEGTGDERGM